MDMRKKEQAEDDHLFGSYQRNMQDLKSLNRESQIKVDVKEKEVKLKFAEETVNLLTENTEMGEIREDEFEEMVDEEP